MGIGLADPRGGTAPSSVQVTIDEWKVPVEKSRPHDPEVAPDGSVWYTAQMTNKLGRLDPASGRVVEYKVPDPGARDPHTPIFDQRGILWFTVQGGNVIGRLDPKTGEIRLKAAPTVTDAQGRPQSSRAYGIKVDSRGHPFVVLFNTNKVVRVDPVTMDLTVFELPDPKARPRRLTITPDDVVWYTDYARGYLGRLDPRTGAVKEFPSPGGPRSQPYGITHVGGIVWYSESGVQPNTLVRFDPASGTFQTWPIPSGGGVVRHMVTAPTGELWLACSGVDRVARVRIRETD